MTTLFSTWSKNPYSYLKLVLYITIFVLNVIILISTGFVTKISTENKPVNLLVANLAVVQLFGIWTMVFEAVGILTLRHPAVCALQTGCFASVLVISSWTLCMLTIDCYRYLCNKQTITRKAAIAFNVVTWILSTLLIIVPHSLSYKAVQSNRNQCCFLTITAFSMLIIIFIIILVSVAVNLWTYVLTLIVLFKKDVNEWSEANNRTVTNNDKKAQTKIEVNSKNYTPSNLVKEVLETAFENKVTNIVTDNSFSNQVDSESTVSYNSENSDHSDDSESMNSNRIKSIDMENDVNYTSTPKSQGVSTINEIYNEANVANDLGKGSTKFSNSAKKLQNEAFPEDIQNSGEVDSEKIDEVNIKYKTHKETANNNSSANVDNNESLVQFKPVILVCLLNFCFIVTWTPYITLLFIYISICGIENKVQICYGLEANLFPAVITIGLIDWIINPVIYFYVRNRI